MSPKQSVGSKTISQEVRRQVGVRFHAVWDAIQELERTVRALSKTLLDVDEWDIEPTKLAAQRRSRKRS